MADPPRWLMPAVDLLLAFAAFGLAYYIRYDLQILRPVFERNAAPFEPYLPYMLIYTGWLFVNYRGARLYRYVRGRPWLEEVYIIVNGVTNATVLIMAVSFILQPVVFSRLMLVYAAAITVLLLASARVVQRMVRTHLRSKGLGVQRVLIVGVGDTGQAVLRTMIARKELGYQPVGYLDDNPNRGSVDLGRVRGLGRLENLTDAIYRHGVDLVVITLRWKYHDRIVQMASECRHQGVEVRVVPEVFQLNTRQVQIENLDGIPLLGFSEATRFQGPGRLLKRAIDIGLILIFSPLLLLVFGLVALAIRLEGPGPIFYRQRRVGENGREFDMVKFRSMVTDADKYRQ
ncbi:MAG: sugar transferase, partial [Phototrophicaceae bacterium]